MQVIPAHLEKKLFPYITIDVVLFTRNLKPHQFGHVFKECNEEKTTRLWEWSDCKKREEEEERFWNSGCSNVSYMSVCLRLLPNGRKSDQQKWQLFHWACARSIRHHNYSGNSVAGSRILALPVLPVQVVFNNWVCGLLNHLVQVLTSAPLMTTTTTRHLVVVAHSLREARFNRICYIVTEA